MNRTMIRGVMLVAWGALAGAASADVLPVAYSAEGHQGPAAMAPSSGSTPLPVMGAEEPKRLPPSEVRGYRDEQVPCDRRHSAGQEACRAQLAAKYAEMDKLCRIVSSGTELPVCIRSAYAAD